LALAVALGYLIPMYVVDVPTRAFPDPIFSNETLPPASCGTGVITADCNAAAFLDYQVFGSNWMELPTDPDGLFSTLSAVVTTFVGLEFGRVIRNYKGLHEHVLGLSAFLSASCLVVGIFCNIWMPYVRDCWTLSYALSTAGIAGIAQCVAYYVVDVAQWKENPALHLIIQPLVWIGSNPITIFVSMIAVEIIGQNAITGLPPVQASEQTSTLWEWVFQHGFCSWISSVPLASMIFAFAHLILWTLLAWLLYTVGLFIRL